MAESAARLVSFADLDDRVEPTDGHVMSIRVRHEAVLTDGSRVLLLDDRGWTTSGLGNIWDVTPAEEVARTTRMVVGPDEPYDDLTTEDMARAHWQYLARILEGHRVAAGPGELQDLPHDVELSARLRSRLGAEPA